MVKFEFNGESIYIDGRLKTKFDNFLPSLKKKDKDCVFVIDGEERIGKSVFAMGMASYAAKFFGTKFDISNICMSPDEFKKRIKNSKKNEVIIYDEAHRGMASSRSLSEVNKILKDLMMEMGQLNLLVLIVLPTFFMLDKYAALFRARGLFHIYENQGRRGFWVYYDRDQKKNLYIRGKKELNYNCMKYPHCRGRFYDKYPVDEVEYREKKRKTFNESSILPDREKKRIERGEAGLVLLRKKLKLSQRAFAEYLEGKGFPISRERITQIELKIKRDFPLILKNR
jgi:hypothetical protein